MPSLASPTGLLPSMAAASLPLFGCSPGSVIPVLYPAMHRCTAVLAVPRSLATTCGITVVFFSCGYLDVSVPRVSLRQAIYSPAGARASPPGGFPHSDICGSMAICASPQLFAACRVLRRLLVPRHSPCALISLTFPFGAAFSRFPSGPFSSVVSVHHDDFDPKSHLHAVLLFACLLPFVSLLLLFSLVFSSFYCIIWFSRCRLLSRFH